MPPLSFDFHHGERDPRATTVGITTSLMNTLVVSRSKMQQWAEFEKAKADKVAESYRLHLIEEQAAIDEQATNLLSVQLERGLKVVDGDESHDNIDIQDNNIVTKKKDLEEEKVSLEGEISRLEQEFENREKRVSGELYQIDMRKTACILLFLLTELQTLSWRKINSVLGLMRPVPLGKGCVKQSS
jgi:hypothetical protein